MKSKPTKRKFYNKWLYKITVNIPGGSIIRDRSLSEIINLMRNAGNTPYSYSIGSRAKPFEAEIIQLVTFLESWPTSEWGRRFEHNFIDVYTNNQDLYDKFSEEFKSIIVHRFAPDPETIDLLDDSFKIIVKKLPHNKYRYKVFLLPHKLKHDVETKQKYLDWVGSQSTIRLSSTVKNWFIKTDWNWDRRYVLVEDEYTLLMLKLRNSEVVGQIYNYVIADK